MKFNNYLKEEYSFLMNVFNRIFPVYMNPNYSEIKELVKDSVTYYSKKVNPDRFLENIEVRTILDVHNKKLFIYNAFNGVHKTVLDILIKKKMIDILYDNKVNVFCDVSYIKDFKLYCNSFEPATSYFVFSTKVDKWNTDEFYKKIEWTKKYFTGALNGFYI